MIKVLVIDPGDRPYTAEIRTVRDIPDLIAPDLTIDELESVGINNTDFVCYYDVLTPDVPCVSFMDSDEMPTIVMGSVVIAKMDEGLDEDDLEELFESIDPWDIERINDYE